MTEADPKVFFVLRGDSGKVQKRINELLQSSTLGVEQVLEDTIIVPVKWMDDVSKWLIETWGIKIEISEPF